MLVSFDTLDTYGKDPEQLKNAKKVFQFVLADYQYSEIEEAFKVYLKNNKTMPKPADIANIIDPPVEPFKWCKMTYLEIKKKQRENVFTTIEEDQYCKDFIDTSVKGNIDNKQELASVIKQEQIEHNQYWGE